MVLLSSRPVHAFTGGVVRAHCRRAVSSAHETSTSTSLPMVLEKLRTENEVLIDADISRKIASDGFNDVFGANGFEMNQPNERYKAITLQSLDEVAERHPKIILHLDDIKLAGLIFPFKASPYFVDELINWNAEDIRKDPFYKLVFPIMDMLSSEHQIKLREAPGR